MIKASLVQSDISLLNNNWFSNSDKIIRDKQNLCYSVLKEFLIDKSIDLSTHDINTVEESKYVIFIDIPKKKYIKKNNQSWILIINEAPCAYPENWNKSKHNNYDYIFTWDENLVDNKKYFLIRLAYDLEIFNKERPFKNRKFLALISGAKSSSYLNNLYGARYKIAKWYSNHHPEKFYLYGRSWPLHLRPIFHGSIERRFSKSINYISSFFYKKNNVYKGAIKSKREILSKFKFSICYENLSDKKGFITEKIFDSICSKCVPVYLGCTNISDLIPKECYIDARKFSSIKSMHKFLLSIDEKKYNFYIENIIKFLKSEKSKIFKPKYFSKTIANVLK